MKKSQENKENTNIQYPKKNNIQNIIHIFRAILMVAIMTSGVQGFTQNKNTNTIKTQRSTNVQKEKKDTLPQVDHTYITSIFPLQIFREYGKEVGMALLRKHLLIEINKIRKSHGKSELVLDEYLNQRAQEYAEYMAKNNHFAHEDLQGRNFYSRVNNGDYLYYFLQENLGKGLMTIETFLEHQMTSPRHKSTIIESNVINAGGSVFKYFGAGYKSGYRIIVFGGEKAGEKK